LKKMIERLGKVADCGAGHFGEMILSKIIEAA
jgi:hypothetical protein